MCELQMVNVTLRVLSRPEFSQLPRIFQTLGLKYDEKVLLSIGNEVLKAVVVQFNADQLLIERSNVSALVRQSLVHRAKDFNIVLDDVAITHLLYGAEFSKAVEQKKYYYFSWLGCPQGDNLVVGRGAIRSDKLGCPKEKDFFNWNKRRINMKQVISFLRGLLSSFHLKCKKSHFVQSLEEAKMYLSEQKLPKRMLKMQNAVEADDCASGSREDEKGADSGEDCRGDERIHSKLEGTKTCPFEIGDLQVISLGKIVKDSEYFQDGRFIWPEGYTVVRKFPSIVDPSIYTLYKMEVLKCNDASPKTQPLFRVMLDNGKQWDALENNSALILYGGGAIFAIWLSSVISRELSSRKELADEIEALKKKIAGSG